ncbi:MAG: hypothetical protein ACRET1_09645, partial [Burkholderiales bacterium]
LFDVLSGLRLPESARFRERDYIGTREAFMALTFAALIVAFCVLDLTLFPIPLFDKPTAYANLSRAREHVRHISDICWVLPPIGMLCTRRKWLRSALIAIGLLFPVLVIDRNRMFASLFSIAVIIALRRNPEKPLPWKRLVFLTLTGCTAFSALGIFRSGTLHGITLPFSALYRAAPTSIQWLLFYASIGPYNFGSLLAKHYSNADFLIHQLVPMTGSIATAGTGIPLDSPTANVGTEFLPFLMAWGPVGAVLAMLALYAMMLWSVRRLRASVSLFSLLVFLRIAYVCVMSPFAPQAFTWTNFGFIGVCLVLQLLAAWLPNRGTRPRSSGFASGFAGKQHSIQPQTQA